MCRFIRMSARHIFISTQNFGHKTNHWPMEWTISVHVDQSCHFGRSDRKCVPFRLTKWFIAFNIVPRSPGWGLTFSSYPWRLVKIAFTPEDFLKIWVYLLRIWVLPLKNFVKIIKFPKELHMFFARALLIEIQWCHQIVKSKWRRFTNSYLH